MTFFQSDFGMGTMFSINESNSFNDLMLMVNEQRVSADLTFWPS